jgi:hypothetical protein
MQPITVFVLAIIASPLVFGEEKEKMWICTLEYHNKTHAFSADDSKRLKVMFEGCGRSIPRFYAAILSRCLVRSLSLLFCLDSGIERDCT